VNRQTDRQTYPSQYFAPTRERINSSLTARIVNIISNSLPNSVVDTNSVNAFKARLDKFWLHQEVMFEFTADLSGTGNRLVLS